HGACVEQDDKGWDARKRAYCLKIQPATGSFARNLIYSTKPVGGDRQYALTVFRQSDLPVPKINKDDDYEKYGVGPQYVFRCVINK
ncbi:hypothetical protein ACO0FP_22205, partial [Klebsiella pneumoniae]